MSLLDARLNSAWTTVQIDRGPAYGFGRYGGYAPPKYLDNMAALAYGQQFPFPHSSIMQWDGRAWRHLLPQGRPR